MYTIMEVSWLSYFHGLLTRSQTVRLLQLHQSFLFSIQLSNYITGCFGIQDRLDMCSLQSSISLLPWRGGSSLDNVCFFSFQDQCRRAERLTMLTGSAHQKSKLFL